MESHPIATTYPQAGRPLAGPMGRKGQLGRSAPQMPSLAVAAVLIVMVVAMGILAAPPPPPPPQEEEEASRAVIGVSNLDERADYEDTVVRALLELNVRVVNLTRLGTKHVACARARWLTGYWGLSFSKPDQFAAWGEHQHVNSVVGVRDVFGEKEALARLARRVGYRLPGLGEFTPEAFVLPDDSLAFRKRVERNPHDLFVRKMLGGHSGMGIHVMEAREVWNLTQQLEKPDPRGGPGAVHGRTVVQKHVDDPLLVDGHKFDVRWWGVLTSVRPLRAYMLRDGYAKVATSEPFDPMDFANRCAHITNNAVQKQCWGEKRRRTGRRAPMGGGGDLDQSVRSAEFQSRVGPGATYDALYAGAHELFVKLLTASQDELALHHQRVRPRPPRMFQLLAVDVIYERASLRPWLLEVNTNGYLRSGLMKIPSGFERLKEMFVLTGFVGYTSKDEMCRAAAPAGSEAAWERANKGEWADLFPNSS